MNELLLHDGGLLFVDGGLTTDPNCCCYYEPPECPPCCVRIDWGTFDDDGNLTATFPSGEFNEVTIKITMPTPNSRIVCDTEHIIIRWELSGPGDPDMTGGRLRHGACWHHVAHTPVETDNGKIYDYGLTDFGFDSESSFYEVELKFHSCFLDASGAFLGYLIIETEFPADFSEEIDVFRCPTSDYCCLPQIDCQDCCALITDPSALWDGDLWIVRDDVDPEEGHFTVLIRIETSTLGMVCEGESLRLTIYFIPPYQGDGIEHDVHIDHEPSWARESFEPALGVGGELTDIKTDWGTTDETEFVIELVNGCTYDDGECDFLAFPAITITSSVWNTTGVEFTECNLEDCCDICCCDRIQGFNIEVSGVENGAATGCDCSSLNISVYVPKTSTVDNVCSGTLILDGIENCTDLGEAPWPIDTTQEIRWILTCNLDGSHNLFVFAQGVKGSVSDGIGKTVNFPAGVCCRDLSLEQINDLPPPPEEFDGDYCNHRQATLRATPVTG